MNGKISEKIRYVGVNDLADQLFENQWYIPTGISYNSYLVTGDKIALTDTAAADFNEQFISNIKREIGDRRVDYLVINHMEPDHSALISSVRKLYPDITIVTNARAVPMLKGFNNVCDNIQVIKENDRLSLGGLTLEFHMIPMVHWPETMATYCIEEKTVFSGDAFGSYGAVNDKITDDSETFRLFRDDLIRYYSNIVGKYGKPVNSALEKLSCLDIKRICPTHGPVWEKNIPEIVSLYQKMSKYETDRGVCLVYGSMYGNTEKAAMALAGELEKLDIPCAVHDLCTENPSFALRDVFKYDILAAGGPTYNNDIFPPVRNFIYSVCSRLVKNHKFVSFGSYSWGGGSVRLMNEMAAAHGMELISDGIQFSQAYSKEKCDMKALAGLIANC
ncbi:MAG: FprA family A-type flavoprotein [Bacteroidales bacterium]|jgi:flavorubredoxin|nr:FprA family A-type flavoprotein [Bacteroidales bacterium]